MGLHMRYWFMPLVLVFLVASGSNTQDKKNKKDNDKKEMQEITEFAGKDFLQWKAELKKADPAEREVAFRAIVMFPLRKVYTALPDILKELKRHNRPDALDLSVRVNGLIALGKIFQAKHSVPEEEFIAYMKEAGKDADPKKIKIYQEKMRADPAYITDALAIYRQSLRDDQIILKVRAVQTLPALLPDARTLIPDVALVARDGSSWEVRKEGLICLAILAYPAEEKKTVDPKIVAIIRSRLDPPEYSALVKIAAAHSLGKLFPVMEKKDQGLVLDKAPEVGGQRKGPPRLHRRPCRDHDG